MSGFNNEKNWELAADILQEESEALLNDIVGECKALERRHKAASNEVAAAIVWEAFYDDANGCGYSPATIERRFARSFPNLHLFI